MRFFGFHLFLLKHSLENPIINMFYNPKTNNIGFLDNKGELFKYNINNNNNYNNILKKYGSINLKKNNFKYYEELGDNWIITTMNNNIFQSKKKKFISYNNSTLIYNSFSNSSFFQIYSNGYLFKDGEFLEIDESLYHKNWINAMVYGNKYLILINLDQEIIIYDLEFQFIAYKETYICPSHCFKISISEKDKFIHLYIGYKNVGIRLLGFFGGFNNNIQKMFLPVSDLEDFTSCPNGPYITYHNNKNITIYKKNRVFPFEKIYTGFFPSILNNINDIKMVNETIYCNSFHDIYSLSLYRKA